MAKRQSDPRQNGTPPVPERRKPPEGGQKMLDQKPTTAMPPRRTWLVFLLILLANYLLVQLFFPSADEPVKVPYTQFKQQVASGNVDEIFSQGESITGRLKTPITYPTGKDSIPGVEPREVTTFETTLPSFLDAGLEALLIDNGVEISAEPIEVGGGLWTTLLFGFAPALLLIGFYVWLYRRAAKGGGLGGMGGGLMGIGKRQARRVDQEQAGKITFDDVAGIDEAENELVEIVERETLDEHDILEVTGLPPAPALEAQKLPA